MSDWMPGVNYYILLTIISALLTGCGGGSSSHTETNNDSASLSDTTPGDDSGIDASTGSNGSGSSSDYTVGGTLTGMLGSGLVVKSNATDSLTLNANGNFTFSVPIADGKEYNVTIASQPANPSQTCSVNNGAGITSSSNISDITIVCAGGYPVVDTNQAGCFDNSGSTTACPSRGETFHGQDAQHSGNLPAYTDNGDGTVSDRITGLMWQQSPDTNADNGITTADKLTYSGSASYCTNLSLAGYSDWRLPDIKQLYSLIDFNGTDPSGYEGADTSALTPFIDTNYFSFAYGDTSAGERIIDAQYASSTLYVSNTANDGGSTLFGVNFADGRIKGYGLTLMGQDKTFYVTCVRGNTTYGENDFVDNGNGTLTDNATGLMWAQNDSGMSLNWEEALAWVATNNSANYLGYSDWRMPDAKELQSLIDYTRSPDTTGTAAIDPVFVSSTITNEASQADYPFYWSNTTHLNWTTSPGANGVYLAFGRALGYMNSAWVDVHGAGAQRSDPKSGDPASFPTGHGPQGDAIRIYNYVRLVRDAG